MALGRIITGGPRPPGAVLNRCLRLRQFPTQRLRNRNGCEATTGAFHPIHLLSPRALDREPQHS